MEIDLKEFNFSVAFKVSMADEGKHLNDSEHVEWYATVDEVDKNGTHLVHQVGIHKCSEEELE